MNDFRNNRSDFFKGRLGGSNIPKSADEPMQFNPEDKGLLAKWYDVEQGRVLSLAFHFKDIDTLVETVANIIEKSAEVLGGPVDAVLDLIRLEILKHRLETDDPSVAQDVLDMIFGRKK